MRSAVVVILVAICLACAFTSAAEVPRCHVDTNRFSGRAISTGTWAGIQYDLSYTLGLCSTDSDDGTYWGVLNGVNQSLTGRTGTVAYPGVGVVRFSMSTNVEGTQYFNSELCFSSTNCTALCSATSLGVVSGCQVEKTVMPALIATMWLLPAVLAGMFLVAMFVRKRNLERAETLQVSRARLAAMEAPPSVPPPHELTPSVEEEDTTSVVIDADDREDDDGAAAQKLLDDCDAEEAAARRTLVGQEAPARRLTETEVMETIERGTLADAEQDRLAQLAKQQVEARAVAEADASERSRLLEERRQVIEEALRALAEDEEPRHREAIEATELSHRPVHACELDEWLERLQIAADEANAAAVLTEREEHARCEALAKQGNREQAALATVENEEKKDRRAVEQEEQRERKALKDAMDADRQAIEDRLAAEEAARRQAEEELKKAMAAVENEEKKDRHAVEQEEQRERKALKDAMDADRQAIEDRLAAEEAARRQAEEELKKAMAAVQNEEKKDRHAVEQEEQRERKALKDAMNTDRQAIEDRLAAEQLAEAMAALEAEETKDRRAVEREEQKARRAIGDHMDADKQAVLAALAAEEAARRKAAEALAKAVDALGDAEQQDRRAVEREEQRERRNIAKDMDGNAKALAARAAEVAALQALLNKIPPEEDAVRRAIEDEEAAQRKRLASRHETALRRALAESFEPLKAQLMEEETSDRAAIEQTEDGARALIDRREKKEREAILAEEEQKAMEKVLEATVSYNDEYKELMKAAAADATSNPSLKSDEPPPVPFIGFSLAEVVGQGVLVVDGLYKDGPAYQTGIRIGDALIRIEGQDVATIADVRRVVDKRCRCGRVTPVTLRTPTDNQYTVALWIMTADRRYEGKPFFFDVRKHERMESDIKKHLLDGVESLTTPSRRSSGSTRRRSTATAAASPDSAFSATPNRHLMERRRSTSPGARPTTASDPLQSDFVTPPRAPPSTSASSRRDRDAGEKSPSPSTAARQGRSRYT